MYPRSLTTIMRTESTSRPGLSSSSPRFAVSSTFPLLFFFCPFLLFSFSSSLLLSFSHLLLHLSSSSSPLLFFSPHVLLLSSSSLSSSSSVLFFSPPFLLFLLLPSTTNISSLYPVYGDASRHLDGRRGRVRVQDLLQPLHVRGVPRVVGGRQKNAV